MLQSIYTIMLGLLVMLPLCGVASAQEQASANTFYLRPGVSFYALELPDYSPIALTGLGFVFEDRLTVEDGEMAGPQWSLTAGWEREDCFGPHRNLVLEGSFYYASMDNTDEKLFDYTAANRVG